METNSILSAPQIPLPPMPARGSRDTQPSDADFRTMLASQGIAPPKNGAVPTADEARIAAAQIAAKANVNAGVKRGTVLPSAQAPAPVVTAPPERFMPLRAGPSAARVYSGPAIQHAATTTTLRAITRFPTGTPTQATLAPSSAVARSAPAVSAPQAIEAYNYGLNAVNKSSGEIPAWFGDAYSKAMDKYDAMKAKP